MRKREAVLAVLRIVARLDSMAKERSWEELDGDGRREFKGFLMETLATSSEPKRADETPALVTT